MSLSVAATSVFGGPLITPAEAALPAASGVTANRGITRGPAIKQLKPSIDTSVAAPFDWKVQFEPRGGEKIDPASVRVTYIKSPFVDLTSRLQSSITAEGIDFVKAEVPPGEHLLRVTVKDTAGRESNSIVTLKIAK
jgi:hypothetical protein